jgi:hypothetical protein
MDMVDIKTRDVRTARVTIVEPFRGVATFWGKPHVLYEAAYSLLAGVSTGKG